MYAYEQLKEKLNCFLLILEMMHCINCNYFWDRNFEIELFISEILNFLDCHHLLSLN
jgi:hypothetical protein